MLVSVKFESEPVTAVVQCMRALDFYTMATHVFVHNSKESKHKSMGVWCKVLNSTSTITPY